MIPLICASWCRICQDIARNGGDLCDDCPDCNISLGMALDHTF